MYSEKTKIATLLVSVGAKNLMPVRGIKDKYGRTFNDSSAGKLPLWKDWGNKPVTLEQLENLWKDDPNLNFGVITGDGLIVLDFDPKNGGLETLKEIEHLLDPTFIVETGSGGYHYYYYLPEHLTKTFRNKTNLMKGFDIRCNGGYVVAPGSLHKSGNYYEIAESSLEEIRPINGELLELILEADKPKTTALVATTEQADYIEEGTRDCQLFSLACTLRNKGLPTERVYEGISALNDTIVGDPLPPKELRKIVKSAMSYPRMAPKNFQDLPTKEQIDELYLMKLKHRELGRQMARLIIDDLARNGRFYKSDCEYYYQDNETQRAVLIHEKSMDFKIILAEYGVNASTREFKFVYEELLSYCAKNAAETTVRKGSYYDRKTNSVYFDAGDGIFKVTTEEKTYCPNGTDGVLFGYNKNLSPFTYVETLDSDVDYLNEHVLKLGNFKPNAFTKDEQRILTKIYAHATLMPELLKGKPAIVLIGLSGTGKTTFARAILTALQGEKADVAGLPNKLEDLDVIVSAKQIVVIDNFDTHLQGLNDRFAVYTTGGSMPKRKLYTDGETYEKPIECFIIFTTRNLVFKREDVLQRLIVLELDTLKGAFKTADILSDVVENRDKILSQMMNNIQNVLRLIKSGKYEDYTSSFRMSDFAYFGTLLFDDKDKIEAILAKMTDSQRAISLEFDVMLPLLVETIRGDEIKSDQEVSADWLYKWLYIKAATKAETTRFKNDFALTYPNVSSFAKRLNNIIDTLSDYIIIKTRIVRGNRKLYSFAKGKRFNDLA